MQAFVLERYGKQRALHLADMPEPTLAEDEALVQVHAASVNQLDSKLRDGEFKLILPYRLPIVLGHDVAGVVTRVGARVQRFKPGDEVYARTDDFRIGTFAERVAVKESSLAFKPRSLSMEEAASMPLVGLTAWQALVEMAQLQRGQFGKAVAAPAFVQLVMRLLSSGIRRRAKARGVDYRFLFMKPSGQQLQEIARLVDAGAIRPVIDQVFPFASTNEALAYVDSGRARGKVVVKLP